MPASSQPRHAPEPIEPNRRRRIARERDPIDGRIDLHGMTRFEAEDRLKAFVRRAHADGWRAVLVITGKGPFGDGMIRRWAPVWLADPGLRDAVAGVAQAGRQHGGEGALYVALKRRRT
jgi:DNA-nicking Smr family endonuclease